MLDENDGHLYIDNSEHSHSEINYPNDDESEL
jgi:hypothetical protein